MRCAIASRVGSALGMGAQYMSPSRRATVNDACQTRVSSKDRVVSKDDRVSVESSALRTRDSCVSGELSVPALPGGSQVRDGEDRCDEPQVVRARRPRFIRTLQTQLVTKIR